MRATSLLARNVSFFGLVAVFAFFVVWLSLGRRLVQIPFNLLAGLAIALAVLGVVEVLLTLRLHEPRAKRVFFLLTGISAAAMPTSAFLHNVVYGLFIWWFGNGFWERHGSDEPFFFLLAVVVCPALFLIGTVGSIVFLTRGSEVRQK